MTVHPTLCSASAAGVVATSLVAPTSTLAGPYPTVILVEDEKCSAYGARPGSPGDSGSDVRAPAGTLVSLPAGGIVACARPFYVYRLMAEVGHLDGSPTRHVHPARIVHGVALGTKLAAGQPVDPVGQRTGRTTGPNLHMALCGVAIVLWGPRGR